MTKKNGFNLIHILLLKPFRIHLVIEKETNRNLMKKIISLLFNLIALQGSATSYYLATSGNDANSGTSSANPWQTIAQLNTVSFMAGDVIYFKCGDIFRGTILINQGGNSGNPVTFTSFGTGSLPVISGAEPVTGWSLNSSTYEANVSTSVTSFFVNNKEQELARYPNEHHYLTLDSAQISYLRDASLTSLPSANIAGKICVHTAQWCWEKSVIASFTGDKITFTSPLTLAALNNYSYFLYDDITHLDTLGEWYYNNLSQVLSYKCSTNPNGLDCQVSVYSNGIQLGASVSYININNLSFEKQGNSGILIPGSSNTHILTDHCSFLGQFNHGVNDKGRNNEVSNSTFRDVDGIAVFVNGTGGNCTIHHNIFKNTGQFRNNGIGTQINLTAIKCAFVDSCFIHHNDIDSAGYCGIAADGAHHLIERNIVKNAMLLNNDGAAIKSFGSPSMYNIIRNNFISKSDGNTEGCNNPNFVTPAIYFDFNVSHCVVNNNTIYDRTKKGIFLNSGTNNNSLQGNVVYGFNYAIDFNGSPAQPTPMTGMDVRKNYFFAKDPNAFVVKMIDNTGGFNQGTIDSNFYFQPYNTSNYGYFPPATTLSFQGWQSTTGLDSHTKSSFVNWTFPFTNDTLIMNPTDSAVIVSLGTNQFLNLDSIPVCESLTLDPYCSIILIRTNDICSTLSSEDLIGNSSIDVYPNPASSQIRIASSKNLSNCLFELYDLSGRKVKSGKTGNGEIDISLNGLDSGLYILILRGDKTYSAKVIKQ